MSKKLELKLLLDMVDKVTGPLKKIREASGGVSGELKATRDKLKELNKQSAQIDGYKKVSRSLSITSAQLQQAQLATQQLASKMETSQAAANNIAKRYAMVKVKVDTLNQATGVTPQVLRKAKAELKQLSGELKTSQSGLNSLTKEQQQALDKLKQLKTAHGKLKTSHKQMREELRASGIDTRKLGDAQKELKEKIERTTDVMELQRKKLEAVSRQQKRLSDASASYQKAKALQGNMAGAGATAAASGAAALYAGSQVLQPGLDFTAAQSKVQALTRLDKNDPQLIALRKQARELGASTSFTANDVSQGQSFLAMAGFDAKSIKQAMPGMLDLAKANDTDLGATADIASNILSGFGLGADQMDRLGDVLTATTTRANVDLTMLGETMKYVAPAARDLGVSVEEASAMAGLLGNIGIQASQGGTVMRAMLNRLAGQTGPAADAIEYLGLKTKDSAGNLRAVPDILADVVKATKGMGNADRADILKTIFGEEAGTGVSELIKKQGDGAITAFANVLRNSAGENARVAKTMADNAKGDIDTLKSAWEDVGIELFEGNDSAIRSFIQQITGVVNSIGNWMRENPELTSTLFKAAAAIAAIVAVGGTLLITLAGLLGPLAMLQYGASILGIKSLPLVGSAITKLGGAFSWILGGLKSLSIALFTTPIGWLILGITALIGAGYLLVTHWDTVKAWMADFWQTIKSLAGEGIEAVKNYFSGLPEPLKAVLSSIWETMKTVFSWSPIGIIVNNFDNIVSYLTGLPAKFSSLGEMTMDGLINGITSKIAALKETMFGMGRDVISSFKEILGIASPSKVFAVMGDQTMQGLTVGLNRSQQEPLSEINKLSKQMAGTAFVLGISALPAAAMPNDVTNPQSPAPIVQHREIIEQLSPAKLSQPEDAVRQVRDEHSATALSAVPSANREIIEQLSPAKLSQPEDIVRQVREEYLGTALQAIPDQTRTIRDEYQGAAYLPNSSVPDAIRLVKEGELPARKPNSGNLSPDDSSLAHNAAPDRLSAGSAFVQRQAPQPQTVHIDAGIHAPITVYATANMDTQDVARLIAIELEKRERAQQARLRSSFKDLN